MNLPVFHTADTFLKFSLPEVDIPIKNYRDNNNEECISIYWYTIAVKGTYDGGIQFTPETMLFIKKKKPQKELKEEHLHNTAVN